MFRNVEIMISYKDTEEKLNIRGIKFTPIQFSFSMLIAIGINKYEAYKLTIKEKEFHRTKEDALEAFNDKCRKDCDILMEQQTIISLVDILKDEYERKVAEDALNVENIELTQKQLKNILGKLIVNAAKSDSGSNNLELIKSIDNYIKNFTIDDGGDKEFSRHFIQIYPKPFNGICPKCNKEIDIPFGLSFTTTCCGSKLIWDDESERYLY